MKETRTLGFRDGFRAAWGGLKFVVTTPATWGWALIPAAVALALIVASGVGFTTLALHLFAGLRHGTSTVGVVLGYIGSVVSVVGALLLAVVVGLSLAQPIAGFALDALSRMQEKALGGPDRPDGAFLDTAWRGLRVTLAGLAIGVPLILVLSVLGAVIPLGFIITVPLKFMVAGLLVAWDFLDYPLGLRSMAVRDRLRWIRANYRGVLAFGLLSGAILLIPGVGLLILPVGVVGATRLVAVPELPPPAR